jgi:lipopolysaccharide transport system permease protein
MRFVEFLRCYFWPVAHVNLIWQLARREVLGRYRGSLLGLGWSFVSPLLMLGVYTFVFVGVFKARWPGAESGGGVEFALQLMAGLMVFNLFAELASRAPHLVLEQPNLVKKVIFPLEVLPWVSVLAAGFHWLLNALVLCLAVLAVRGALPVSALALPLVIAAFLPFLLGLCWFLSALGVFVRDVNQMMLMVVSMGMFLSPVFYSSKALPEILQGWMWLNPLVFVIESVRAVLLQGLWPDWWGLLVYAACACGAALAGAGFFHLTRKGFADVL